MSQMSKSKKQNKFVNICKNFYRKITQMLDVIYLWIKDVFQRYNLKELGYEVINY